MPEALRPESSIEIRPRRNSYHYGVTQSHPTELSMGPKLHRDETTPTNWRDAFNGKWPYINPLFHKSGESTISKLQNQTTNIETALHRSTASINSSQWNGSINDIWTDSRRNSEAFDLDSSFEPDRKKSKECERICRRLLCAFLAVSIIGAIMTGIGLTLVISSHKQGGEPAYTHETQIDPQLSAQEKLYLTQTFCNLVKTMLSGVDFPVEKGIASCHVALRLIDPTEGLNFQINIRPQKGFTIKEKFRRSLTEGVLADGIYRINGTNECLSVDRSEKRVICDKIQINGTGGLANESFNDDRIVTLHTEEMTSATTHKIQTTNNGLQDSHEKERKKRIATTIGVMEEMLSSTPEYGVADLSTPSSYSEGQIRDSGKPTKSNISLGSTNMGYHENTTVTLYEQVTSTTITVNKVKSSTKNTTKLYSDSISKSSVQPAATTAGPVTTTTKSQSPIVNTTGLYIEKVTNPVVRTSISTAAKPSLASSLKSPREAEDNLMWQLSLYGSSKSKNYLRFPIVTGSNGKFLFSPLSNKDSIDISKKTNGVGIKSNDNQTQPSSLNKDLPKVINVPDNVVKDKVNIVVRVPKKVPKALKVDWKTPPLAKPTKLPSGGGGGSINDSPSRSKVIFKFHGP